MLRRRFLQLVTSLLTATSLHGIGGCQSRSPLRIAGHVFPGYEFLFLARDESWLDPGLVELVETESASHSLAALADEQLDGALLTLDETLQARSAGIPLTVVMLLDRSVGADALLAAPGLKLGDLKGKRLGVETSAVGKLMLLHALQQAGIDAAEINLLKLPVDKHLEACQKGLLDAVITFEPSLSKIQQSGWRVLFDSRDVDLIYDVLAIRSDQLAAHHFAIENLVQGQLRALQKWFDNPIDTGYRLSRRLNVPASEVAEQFRGLDLPNLDYNRHLLATSNPKLMQVAEEINRTLGLNHPATSNDSPLFTTEFLPEHLP